MKIGIIIGIVVVIVTVYVLVSMTNNNTKKSTEMENGVVTNDEDPPIDEYYESLLADESLSIATVAGGCFWCMEGPFESMDGVKEAVTGFSGGTGEQPTYDEVAAGATDYREAVQIFYDSSKVTYQELLDTFFLQIDPTDEGGQFADRGHQYTTAIYYRTKNEEDAALNIVELLNNSGKYEKPIVTEVLSFNSFYAAEEYHQDFYKQSSTRYKQYKIGSGRQGYIEKNIDQ